MKQRNEYLPHYGFCPHCGEPFRWVGDVADCGRHVFIYRSTSFDEADYGGTDAAFIAALRTLWHMAKEQ